MQLFHSRKFRPDFSVEIFFLFYFFNTIFKFYYEKICSMYVTYRYVSHSKFTLYRYNAYTISIHSLVLKGKETND